MANKATHVVAIEWLRKYGGMTTENIIAKWLNRNVPTPNQLAQKLTKRGIPHVMTSHRDMKGDGEIRMTTFAIWRAPDVRLDFETR